MSNLININLVRRNKVYFLIKTSKSKSSDKRRGTGSKRKVKERFMEAMWHDKEEIQTDA